ISNFCVTKDDGAAIYTWGNTFGGNAIEGNIILNGVGTGEGTSTPTQLSAHGIYIDDRSANLLLKGNTVSNCSSTGVYIHNAKKISLTGNTLFGNGSHPLNSEKGQLLIRLDDLVPQSGNEPLNLLINENIFVAVQRATPCFIVDVKKNGDLKTLGL